MAFLPASNGGVFQTFGLVIFRKGRLFKLKGFVSEWHIIIYRKTCSYTLF